MPGRAPGAEGDARRVTYDPTLGATVPEAMVRAMKGGVVSTTEIRRQSDFGGEACEDPRFEGLIDEIRTSAVQDEPQGYNHLVWSMRSAVKAVERTSSAELVAEALEEDPDLAWDDKPTARQQVVLKALDWLCNNLPKDDASAWRPAVLIEGTPFYLRMRLMRGAVPDVSPFYIKGTRAWGFPPALGPPTAPLTPPPKPKSRRAVPASPSEGASSRRCVNCGSEDQGHPDLWNCKNPRVDVVRTVSELQLLASFDAFKRNARKIRREDSPSLRQLMCYTKCKVKKNGNQNRK